VQYKCPCGDQFVRARGPIQEAARAGRSLNRTLHRNTKRGRMVVMQPAATVDKEKVKGKVQGKVQVTPTSMHCRSKRRCKRLKRRKQEGEGNRSFKAPMDGVLGRTPTTIHPSKKKKHLHLNHPYFSTRHAHSPEWLAAHPRLASSAREGSINEWGAPSAVPTYLVGRPLAAGTSSQG
jgi:hypothetical protein